MNLKKTFLLFFTAILVVSITGCSQDTPKFNGKDIHFKLVNHKEFSGNEVYTIQIKNMSANELTHLEFYLSYPIKKENGSRENPFKIKGKTENITVNLIKGQSVQFTFNAPIKDVFGKTNLLDFKNPDIKLVGYIKKGDKEIPFAMGGGIYAFLDK
jgi:hypothetical protein